jgi:hypothetical protein
LVAAVAASVLILHRMNVFMLFGLAYNPSEVQSNLIKSGHFDGGKSEHWSFIVGDELGMQYGLFVGHFIL